MTSKDLKRLSRSDLLEILLALSKENDQLRKANETLQKSLEDRTISIQNCGSIAEASLVLSGVFQAAEKASRQYLANIEQRSAETEERCSAMVAEAHAQADAIVKQAKQKASAILSQAEKKMAQEAESYAWLKELMDSGDVQ